MYRSTVNGSCPSEGATLSHLKDSLVLLLLAPLKFQLSQVDAPNLKMSKNSGFTKMIAPESFQCLPISWKLHQPHSDIFLYVVDLLTLNLSLYSSSYSSNWHNWNVSYFATVTKDWWDQMNFFKGNKPDHIHSRSSLPSEGFIQLKKKPKSHASENYTSDVFHNSHQQSASL